MSTVTEQIKERVDVVDLISSYLKLQKSGVNYKARCPFHNEKSASFFVSPERQIWHCFGCSAGGDIFGFVKQIEGVEFPDALRTLADRAGIELNRNDRQEFKSNKTSLYEITDLAMKFFEKQLYNSISGKKVVAYLHDRGLTDEVIKRFNLGYAPESWDALSGFLGRKYSTKDIFDAGLTVKKEKDSGYYDRFRSRIIFPIMDLSGRTVGFTGRVFGGNKKDEESAKYINTPQTTIYDKSRVLYGLDKAKLDIRRNDRCLVVEGNMDVIMSHQVGATNVVASSGTALTDGHLKILKRYTDNLDLCFDADAAGNIATDRGVDLALARGFNVGIVSIDEPDLKDPADYVKKYGSKWSEYAAKSRPFMEFYFETAKKTLDITTALGKKLMAQKLMPFLASMTNKIERSHWLGELALALKLKEEVLIEEIAKVKPKGQEEEQNMPEIKKDSPLDVMEESLLALAMKKPELAQNISVELEQFLSGKVKELLGSMKSKEGDRVVAQPISIADSSLAMNLEFVYLKSQEFWKDIDGKELELEFNKILNQIKKKKISARLADLEYDIKSAEKNRDKERLATLAAEFSKISRELPQ